MLLKSTAYTLIPDLSTLRDQYNTYSASQQRNFSSIWNFVSLNEKSIALTNQYRYTNDYDPVDIYKVSKL